MTATRNAIKRTETADEYGRREQCLQNHKRAPFSFQACISGILSTKEETGSDGLIGQKGLRTTLLPIPGLIEDTFDDSNAHDTILAMLTSGLNNAPPPLTSHISTFKDLLLPVEDLDLGSRPEADVREYLDEVSTKRYGDPFNDWLPLSSLRFERDEGLAFPPQINRLQSLLQREVDKDTIIISDIALRYEQEACCSEASGSKDKGLTKLNTPTLTEAYHYKYPDPITPPLSPISSDFSPFIPNDDAIIIDLVSGPSSPTARPSLQDDFLESDPAAPRTLLTSSPSQSLPVPYKSRRTATDEVRADVPLLSTSSDAIEEDILGRTHLPTVPTAEVHMPLNSDVHHFEGPLAILLEERHSFTNKLSAQERLDPYDSVSRIPVPLLDFNIDSPDWAAHCVTAGSHFSWLRAASPSIYGLAVVSRDANAESTLKWTPIPHRGTTLAVTEHMHVSDESIRDHLSTNATNLLSSASFVSRKREMLILQFQSDEELEELSFELGDQCSKSPPPFRVQRSTSPREPNLTKYSSSMYFNNQEKCDSNQINCLVNPTLSYFSEQERSRLLVPLRGKAVDASFSALPKSNSSDATSQLLSNFMELRAAKRPKTNEPKTKNAKPGPETQTERVASIAPRRPASRPMSPTLVPATAPEAEIPIEKGTFLYSISLGTSLLHHLEAVWPSENLIDVDYIDSSQYHAEPQSSNQLRDVQSALSFDADIPLSSTAGILVTSLLKVRQRALPGSTALTPLRERTERVSTKYETLVVLVSECNPSGEFKAAASPSDVTALADFVRFTISLRGEVKVHLVPGAEGTLAKWIISLFCQYSPHAFRLARFISAEEMTEEISLRNAGMNIVAAKVISRMLLEQAGPSGIADFLNMPLEERISRYGQVLGGEKALRSLSA